MKLLQRLSQRLEESRLYRCGDLWTKCEAALRHIASEHQLLHNILPEPASQRGKTKRQHELPGTPAASSPPHDRGVSRLKLSRRPSRSYLLCLVTVASLTSAVGHRFYNAPKLDVGKAAPQTIVAPATAMVEDTKATEEKRKAARKEAISVLMLDPKINQQIQQTIQQQLDQGDDLRQLAGPIPFAKTAILSVPTQVYLRKATAASWTQIQAIVNRAASGKAQSNARVAGVDADQQQAIAELRGYRRSVDADDYATLMQSIEQARSAYTNALAALPPPSETGQLPIYTAALFDLTEADWRQAKVRTQQAAVRILAQGIPNGLPTTILADAVKLQVKNWVPAGTEAMAAQILLSALQPNLMQDEDQTRLRADRAAQDVKPEMVTIHQGDVIVRSGEVISSSSFALLDHFGLSRRGVDWMGLIGFGGLVSAAVAGYWLIEQRFHPGMRSSDRLLILLLSLSTPLLVVLHVPSTNLPAVGMLVGSFYGSTVGGTVVGLLALGLPLGMQMPWSDVLSSAAGGLLCGVLAGRLRSREELALLGGAVGVLQGVVYLLLNVVSGASFYALLGSTVIHGLIGLAWSIVAIGISPYLEQLFDLVTTIRLVELANPNRLLLKKLASKTPGTFQHTLFVATLAEAAARALGCNVELVRAGTLYHDIGKMHDPLGFIENQMGGPNKHDLIDNPWKSAEIIKKHVTEGLVMARKHRLPKAVQAFIPEHQGTMQIAYFYHQAQQRVQEAREQGKTVRLVKDDDFRYDGPAPQSRETGIVMLADSCEAALRSLKDATPQEALAMINKILRARWQDKQLVNSGLTREDMSKIASIFVEVWQQSNHQRIAYPSQPVSISPSPASK